MIPPPPGANATACAPRPGKGPFLPILCDPTTATDPPATRSVGPSTEAKTVGETVTSDVITVTATTATPALNRFAEASPNETASTRIEPATFMRTNLPTVAATSGSIVSETC